MDIKEYYSNRENCNNDILKARKAGGDKNTTFEQFEGLIKALGLMYFYCPSDMKELVYGLMEEMTQRQMYASFSKLKQLF